MTAMISHCAQLERSKSLALAAVCTHPQVSVVLDNIVGLFGEIQINDLYPLFR